MEEKKKKNADRLYTAHGQKMVQGKLSVINGKKALATFKGEEIVGWQAAVGREVHRLLHCRHPAAVL